MKVIGINDSSRKDGNTAILIKKVFAELNDADSNPGLLTHKAGASVAAVRPGGAVR
ncbi:MAG: hypothetical protein LUE16_07735 [Lachnospiraceae bacterium]|nr:hypothetical protein [Lachnospiraceae bacterium]